VQEIYDELGQLDLSDPQPAQGSQDSFPTALTDPDQEPQTVSNLQTGYCAKRVRERVLEILGNIPRVSVIRINIPSEDLDEEQDLATVFVDPATTKEQQQHVAKTCRVNSNLFKSSGKCHLLGCLPDQGLRYYHDGTASPAGESVLKLSDTPPRKIHYETDCPLLKDILANKLTAREVTLHVVAVLEQTEYQRHQFA
jgi:hypothetical protein